MEANDTGGKPEEEADYRQLLESLSSTVVEFFDRLSAWELSVVKDSGLPLPHMHVIELLGNSPELRRMRDLSERLGVTTGTLTVTVDKLEKAGLVQRVANPEDRRSWLIALTAEGKALQTAHSGYHYSLVQETCGDFTAQELAQFINFLERFISRI